mgnify:FL=1
MKIVVCVKQSADGEINPFDASAYETALGIDGAEITLLSMGPEKTAPFLESLTRLGAKNAVLLCDRAFAGADTLATSYALSLAIKRLCPGFVFCGRQSVDGDTGQVGPSLAVRLEFSLVTNVMSLKNTENGLSYTDRSGNGGNISAPAVITLEKSRKLRLPSIRSKIKPVETLSANDINADISLCGLKGSPTRVLKTFENDSDRRSCTFIPGDKLMWAIDEGLKKGRQKIKPAESASKLKNVWCVGSSPIEFAKTVGENITVIDPDTPEKTADKIRSGHPDAVLWGSDIKSKVLAPQVAALLNTGLCADCTALETDGETLYMYRPACSGNIIAKIKCETKPPMATVRTAEEEQNKIIIGIGYGAREHIAELLAFAEKINAGIAATRKMVDSDYLPYELQVGLTGKTVNPDVYIAVGISGAVHHIAGIKQSGTVIAINSDKDAPIFKYADYAIVCEAEKITDFNRFSEK